MQTKYYINIQRTFVIHLNVITQLVDILFPLFLLF